MNDGDIVVASIGGFDLEYSGERFGNDGYRYATMLQRTGADYEIELPVTVTPVGAISRLEHALSNFDSERDSYRHRLVNAKRRLVSYKPCLRERFALERELELKLLELAEIEKDLAATDDADGDGQVADIGRVAA